MPEPSSGGPQLEERIRVLELQVDSLRSGRRRRRIHTPRPLRRVMTIMAVIAAVGILPMVVSASDTFTDVPTANTFHANINNLYNARIANGCATSPSLQYCPTAAVTRAQMAGFLNRGLGRAASDDAGTSVVADASDVDVVSVTINSGGVTGGTGFVVVTGSVSAYTTSGTTCPCEVGMRVVDTTSGESPGLWTFFDVSNTATPTTYRNASGTMSWVFQVPSGVSRTFVARANVDMTGATGFLSLQGQISAVYVPFGSTGASTLSTSDVGAPSDGRAGE